MLSTNCEEAGSPSGKDVVPMNSDTLSASYHVAGAAGYHILIE